MMLRKSLQRRAQSGFGLVELMVAVTIGLFMLGGIGAVFLNLKQTFTSQDALARLQDNERLALIMLTTTIEASGYFPDPASSTAAADLPASSGSYGNLAAGQGLVGLSGTSDSITTRFATNSGDGLMNCLGQVNTSGTKQVFLNTFSVSAANELLCSTDGGATTTAIVGGVSSLSVLYGTDTNGVGTATSYLDAATVTAGGLWSRVKSARVTVTFVNPFATQAGQPPTVGWTQTISLMNKS